MIIREGIYAPVFIANTLIHYVVTESGKEIRLYQYANIINSFDNLRYFKVID